MTETSGTGGSPDVEFAPELTRDLFAAPPTATRPKYRWWMPLAFTDDAELAAELRQMRDAGAGGAEVAAFGVAGAGNDQNPFLEEFGFGTPKWVGKVETMLAAAQREGLGIDLTIGPRWPATVPTVHDINDPAVSKMLVFAHEFHQGGSQRSGPLPTNYDIRPPAGARTTLVAALVAKCVTPGTSDASPPPRLLVRASVQDVTAEVTDDSLTVTFPGDDSETYVLIVFVYTPTGVALSGFTPTGPNYALDILSTAGTRAITEFYDTTVLTPAVRELLHRSRRSDLFEDSLELGETQKWTEDFAREWANRRGYSPLTVLPALCGASQQGMFTENELFFDFDDGSGPRIRTDYRHTHSDVYIANHLDGLRHWARERSLRTRIQPYGTPIDTGEAAAHIDVPEGETLAFGGINTDYSNIEDYKVVASGAHVSGAPVVSSEDCAFDRAVWSTTAGGDRSPRSALRAIHMGFAGGVTQVVWHGFPYLTAGPPGPDPQTKWPGMSYGGNTDYGEAWGAKGSPNWGDYRLVNDALARVQLAMRQGVARFDCAVYRHDFGMNGTWTTGVGDDTLLRSTSELATAGYTYEYLAPGHILRRDAEVRDNTLFPHAGGYRAMILRRQSTMTIAAARAVLSFARDGLPVLVVGDPPAHIPGHDPSGERDKELAEIIAQLMAQRSTHTVAEDEDLPNALRALGIEPAAAPVDAPGAFL